MIGTWAARAAATNPPRPNRWSLYRSRNGLPTPLNPSGKTPDELAGAEEALGVLVGGQRGARAAGDRAEERRLEDEVGAQRPQDPVLRVLVVDRELDHERVERDGARVVGDEEGATVGRDVLDPAHLDPEPVPVDRPEHGVEDVLREVGVVAEVVDEVVAVDPPAQVREHLGDASLDVLGGDPRGLRRDPEHRDQALEEVGDIGERQPGARGRVGDGGVERRFGDAQVRAGGVAGSLGPRVDPGPAGQARGVVRGGGRGRLQRRGGRRGYRPARRPGAGGGAGAGAALALLARGGPRGCRADLGRGSVGPALGCRGNARVGCGLGHGRRGRGREMARPSGWPTSSVPSSSAASVRPSGWPPSSSRPFSPASSRPPWSSPSPSSPPPSSGRARRGRRR